MLKKTDGILPAILNTLYVIVLTLLIVLPLGVGAAVYLTEYASNRRLIEVIEFTNETLAGDVYKRQPPSWGCGASATACASPASSRRSSAR